jgi:hypothetical protein
LAAGKVMLVNRYAFASLDRFVGTWTVTCDGQVVQEGVLPALNIAAGKEKTLTIPYTLPATRPGVEGEYHLNLSFRLARTFAWAPRGFELAAAQLALPVKAKAPAVLKQAEMPALKVLDSAAAVVVELANQTLTFGRRAGTLSAWEYQGISLIHAGVGPRLNAWRAPTDNDHAAAKLWREAGLDRLWHRTAGVRLEQLSPQAVRVVIEAVLAAPALVPAFHCTYTYTVFGSGDVVLQARVRPRVEPALPHLPKLGLQLQLPGCMDRMAWFGRGPQESYPDMRVSTTVGLYRGTVQEQYEPSVRPQENGNKSDVRWVSLTNARGLGLLASAVPGGAGGGLNVSANHYTTRGVTLARHTPDLKRLDLTELNLDYAQGGLGSNSCGPGPMDKYLLQPAELTFAVRLAAFNAEFGSAFTLARRMLETT